MHARCSQRLDSFPALECALPGTPLLLGGNGPAHLREGLPVLFLGKGKDFQKVERYFRLPSPASDAPTQGLVVTGSHGESCGTDLSEAPKHKVLSSV